MIRKSHRQFGSFWLIATGLVAPTWQPLIGQDDVPTDPEVSVLRSVGTTEGELLELPSGEDDLMHDDDAAIIVETEISDEVIEGGDFEAADSDALTFGEWLGYSSTQDDMTWLVGDDFRMFSLESFPTLDWGEESSLMLGTGIHFLDGPVTPDMPPRLFDIQLAYHARTECSDCLFVDLKVGIGAFSDFRGSTRKGIRFPGHAVAYHELNQNFVSVFGVEVFDRDDFSLLPVGGFVWRVSDDLVCELVFPTPKVQVRLDSKHAMYVAGEVGGGTWAIERIDATNDNATYRDIRVVLGVMDFDPDDNSVLEIGWAFDRTLNYRSGVGHFHPGDALILRCRSHF